MTTDPTHAKYLIVGCSHAGLAAMEAIRMADETGPITILSREDAPVYSPTILPQCDPRGEAARRHPPAGDRRVRAPRGRTRDGGVRDRVDAARRRVLCDSGRVIRYEKLLIATGADATVPAFPGVESVPYLVVRTLEDALRLRERLHTAKSAIVIGAGLIAMHTAENLARAGLKVAVVVRRQVSLFAYFDGAAAGMIERIFAANGIRLATGSAVAEIAPADGGCTVTLESGTRIAGDLLLLAAGVRPRTGF